MSSCHYSVLKKSTVIDSDVIPIVNTDVADT